MRGADIRPIFETVLPEELLMRLANDCGFQQRERKLDSVAFLRAMISAASRGEAGRQFAILNTYYESGATRVVRGAFYRWFSPALEKVMHEVSERALGLARAATPDLPGWLGEVVRDWILVDATQVMLDDALKAKYPGTSGQASMKIHKHFSVGVGTTLRYFLTPGKEQDITHLHLDESWRGLGLITDLGYASTRLLRECERHGVTYVIRLKQSWKPKVDRLVRGTLSGPLVAGSDLDVLLEDEVLVLDGKAIDADVTLGNGSGLVRARLVCVHTPKGPCWYLTNLARRVGHRQIADLYRVRWEIELDNKLHKSCYQLDEIGARTGHAARALVHASMTAAALACLVAHQHRLHETRPKQPGTPRTVAPIHVQTLARVLAFGAETIAHALTLEGNAAVQEWDRLAEMWSWRGQDPNWRSAPSILDQLRGWKVTPGRPRRARLSTEKREN
jgi:hypothetical protein